jgi:hypothetical protein
MRFGYNGTRQASRRVLVPPPRRKLTAAHRANLPLATVCHVPIMQYNCKPFYAKANQATNGQVTLMLNEE